MTTSPPAESVGPELVLDFWFGREPYDSAVLARRMFTWFEAGAVFDREVSERFAGVIELARCGHHAAWQSSPRGALALVLLLDQFPRHVYRGSARAFACDALALAACNAALARGFDRELTPVERQFLYLPLQHSENLEDQVRCVRLFAELAAEVPEGHWLHPVVARSLSVARYHELLIRRYGRYPHRNEALRRQSTLAERMYLDAGGPSFGQLPERAHRAGGDAPPVFRMMAGDLDARETLCVDGKIEGLRCLSHWPGTVAPAELQHDLSTGMALEYARRDRAEQLRLLGPFSVVTNDHYDTDGALAAFAIIHPERSLRHADRMLRAARTGDLRTFAGEDALAIDLTIWSIANSSDSPLAPALANAGGYLARAGACYGWLMAELPRLLAEPFAWRSLWQPRFERILGDLRAVDAREGVTMEAVPALDLAVVTSRFALTRHGLIHAARDHNRVLYVLRLAGGVHYRFLYRNESWFLGLRDRVAPRVPLEPARALLAARETARAGRWWCTPLDRTSSQLGFGDPAQAADVFEDLRPDRDPSSRLSPDQVVEALRVAFTASPAVKPAPRAPFTAEERP